MFMYRNYRLESITIIIINTIGIIIIIVGQSMVWGHGCVFYNYLTWVYCTLKQLLSLSIHHHTLYPSDHWGTPPLVPHCSLSHLLVLGILLCSLYNGINATFITVGLSIIGLETSPATLSSILCTSQVDSLNFWLSYYNQCLTLLILQIVLAELCSCIHGLWHMHADSKYTAKTLTLYDMHHRIIGAKMYVISTLNFKKCVSFNVTVTNIFLLCITVHGYACRTKDFRSCLLGYIVEQLLHFLCFFDQSI